MVHMMGWSGAYEAYGVLNVKPERKRPLGRIRCSFEDGIRIDIEEIGWEGVDRIDFAQNRGNWEVILHMVMNVRVPKMRGICSLTKGLLASQVGLYSMEI